MAHRLSESAVFPEPDGPTSATTDGFFIFLFLYNDAFIICSTRYTNSVILLTDKSPVIFEFHGFLMSTGYVAGVSSTLCMASSKIISNCTRFFALPSMIFSVGKSGNASIIWLALTPMKPGATAVIK